MQFIYAFPIGICDYVSESVPAVQTVIEFTKLKQRGISNRLCNHLFMSARMQYMLTDMVYYIIVGLKRDILKDMRK